MAVGGAHVFPGFLTPVLTQLSFQSHRLLCSHASAEVRERRIKRIKHSQIHFTMFMVTVRVLQQQQQQNL